MLSRTVARISRPLASAVATSALTTRASALTTATTRAISTAAARPVAADLAVLPVTTYQYKQEQRSNDHKKQNNNSHNSNSGFDFRSLLSGSSVAAAAAVGLWVIDGQDPAYQKQIKELEPRIREAIEETLDSGDANYDGHGSYGPIYVRLAWHASGTYNAASGTGGSNGATMRFDPESKWGANNGLKIARDRLESVKKQFPQISYADLWTLAAVVAIESAGGPAIPWRAGRSDADVRALSSPSPASPLLKPLPDGLLPDAAQGASHVRDVFYRMGFNDREITALIGAHALGKTHRNASGYDGPWTRAPTTFSNMFYTTLLEEKWQVRKWDGPEQYENAGAKDLMMLPADMVFLWDPEFRKYVDLYAKDEETFFKDFSAAYGKLLELGVPAFSNKKQK